MSEPTNDNQNFPALGFDPANLVTWADLPHPNANTVVPTITSAHLVGHAEDGEGTINKLVWCCHAGEGEDDPSQPLALPLAFFVEDDEPIDTDTAENRVVALANNLARAAWN